MSDISDVIVFPDADRFPYNKEDSALVESAGFHLAPITGHHIRDFSAYADQAVASIAWGGTYDEEFFRALPRLRALGRCGAGYENINLEDARRHGVTVCYVPGASDDEVAEHTLALILACYRRLGASDSAIRAGQWPSAIDLAPMHRLAGSRLGLVGLGRIGTSVARKARSLGMEVHAFDPFVSRTAFGMTGVIPADSMRELLLSVDVVSLHVPGSRNGQPILGSDELALLRRGAVVVNTARGSLIDEYALCRSLETGAVGAAGLDVFQQEPIPATHPLLHAPNVLLTPHSAAFSVEALASLNHRAISDVIAVLRGESPIHPIATPGR